MAALLIGKVYYHDHFAGYLREEPGDRTSFSYDKHYLDAALPPISHTLPLRTEPFITQAALHPFFDNLAAEGWLEGVQTRLLGRRRASRFELLLTFGQDCIGAVSVIDPEPVKVALANNLEPKEVAVMKNRASLSGIQPKFTMIERQRKFYPALSMMILSWLSIIQCLLIKLFYQQITLLTYRFRKWKKFQGKH
jgi:serine/threonine-protein kinase HipA